jgi:hypothetical protein
MPLLSSLLGWLFVGLAEFLGKWLTKKAATGVAGVAVFATLTTAMLTAAALTINGLIPSLPGGTYISLGLWLAVPDNGPAVVSACLATDAAVAVYRWNVSNLNIVNQA